MKKLTTVLIQSILFSNINCKTGIFNNAPNKPTISFPGNNKTLENIPSKLDWNCIDADNDILKYEVCFGTENPPELLASDIEKSEYSGITVESQKTYYWKVIAEDEHGNRTEGDIWSFTMENLPPETPANPIPENYSNKQNPATISWECTEPDGETLTYDIYFGTTDTPKLIEENYTENTYELQNITGNQKYYWKIIAKDTYGNEITGPLWNFTTDIFAPEAISPINNEQNAAWFPKFAWSSDNAGNITYDIYLGTSSNPELLVSDFSNTSFYHLEQLIKEQTYFWKVIAKKPDGSTAESPVCTFTVFGDPQFNSFIDARDGTTYQTVTIGHQTWMAENLKIFVPGSKIYDDDPNNLDIYGRLYNRAQIMNGEEASNQNPSGVQGIAPEGWHIPSDTEWFELFHFLGGQNIEESNPINPYIHNISEKLKETGTEHWISPNGTNESGFTAIPGGQFDVTNGHGYESIGYWARFHTSSEYSYYHTPSLLITNDNLVMRYSRPDYFSLRCVKN